MRASYRKNHWLSDPGCYPVIVALGFASALCAGFGIYTLAANPDVQISTSKRYVFVEQMALPVVQWILDFLHLKLYLFFCKFRVSPSHMILSIVFLPSVRQGIIRDWK